MSEETIKTGIFVRVERDGCWLNVDIADLTQEEFQAFLQERAPERITAWAVGLHRWIIERVDFEQPQWVSVEADLPDDGIEVEAFSPTESDHYGEAPGTFLLVFREEGQWASSETGMWIEDKSISHWKHLRPPGKQGGQIENFEEGSQA